MATDSTLTDVPKPAGRKLRALQARLLALAVRIVMSVSAMAHPSKAGGSEHLAHMNGERRMAFALSTCAGAVPGLIMPFKEASRRPPESWRSGDEDR